VQACSDLVKSDLVEKLRRVDYDRDLADDLKELVGTNNGVVDKSTSTLLDGHWDEVYPKPGKHRFTFAVTTRDPLFSSTSSSSTNVDDDENIRVERERHVLGALFGFVGVYDCRKVDAFTLGLRRRKFLRAKFLGFSVPIPWLFRTAKEEMTFLYVDSDLVLFKDQTKLVVLAPPLERSLFTALLYVARRYQARKKRANIKRAKLRRGAPLSSYKTTDDLAETAEPGPPIGDLVWNADTSMEVDDEEMQSFLDEPLLRANFSVQDMLDGNFRLQDERHKPPSAPRKVAKLSLKRQIKSSSDEEKKKAR